MKSLIISILFVFIVVIGLSQSLSNFRKNKYVLESDTIKLDTLSIVPNTIIVFDCNNLLIPDSLYKIEYAKSIFISSKELLNIIKCITISYRVFPVNFSKNYFHKDYNEYLSLNKNEDVYHIYNINNNYNNFFEKDELNKRGSISRGITFGNNQDVIVNSSLNLQLSGKITDNLNVLAAISDNNIPIQPDGNTQQIQEFDKVYITLFNDNIKLTAGDFDITRPTGHFMNINKKAQGAIFSSVLKTGKKKNHIIKNTISGAVSKGKYNRLSFNGQEGNQGPYKLTGSENETYIIILAGTEKVYIDGKLLKRGQENDYVIDYNTAEIIFTPQQPITKDKRIVAEFQYSEKSYARFLVYSSNEFETNRTKTWINIFSEQDSKNQPLQQSLTDEQKRLLSQIGDSINKAFVPNIDSVTYDNNYIYYRKTDTTLTDGSLYKNIYIYSTNSANAFYRLGFSFVGQGKGNYVQATSAANGKTYEWLAPVNGVLQGSYEPVTLLITPKKKQLITIGNISKLTKTTVSDFEFALSNNNINTFSTKDMNNDIGYAIKLGINQKILFSDTINLKLTSSINYQLINKYFEPIERFRNVEFERDWNLAQDNSKKADENFLNFNISFYKQKLADIKYGFEFLNRNNDYNASKNNLVFLLTHYGFNLTFSGSYLNSKDNINSTNFLRYNSSLSKNISFITIGIRGEQENNRWFKVGNDSLLNNSYLYNQYEAFINNSDTSKINLFSNYKMRRDFLPYENKLHYSTQSQDINIGGQLLKNPNNTFKTVFTFRKLSVNDTLLTTNKPENTITGRIEHNLRLYKSAITFSTFYEVGSGLEVKKEFSYIEVTQGQGVYMWTDYNNNGVKELNEFEIANFQDQANFIRVFTPTNSYIKTYTNQFNEIIGVNPERIWRSKKGIKLFLSKFSDQFAFRIDRKNLQEDIIKNFNPFMLANDTDIISLNSSIRNTFSVNKLSSVWGIDYIYQNNENRILLVNGIDTRKNNINGLRCRWNVLKTITLIDNFDLGNRYYSSEFFSNKNYTIDYVDNEVTLSYQPNLIFRISANYKYTDKKNKSGDEKLFGNNFGLEIKYNILNKGNLSLKANYINLNYKYEVNSSVGYEMLEGLLPGDNGVWTVMFQKSISNKLEVDINYNGRLSEHNKAVHTGGIQIRAYF